MIIKKAIIISGRQNKDLYKNIDIIINKLDADLFLIYDNDICNYKNHSNIKLYKYLPLNIKKDKLYNQYYKLKIGFDLMEKYEKENNIKYDCVIRLRPDIEYIYNENIDFNIENNNVYLNSDFIFYGKKEYVKKCFYLYEEWFKLKKNNFYNIKIENIIKMIESNPDKCFDINNFKYYNKILCFPYPFIKNENILNLNKNNLLKHLNNLLNNNIINYKNIDYNKYELFYYNKLDKIRNFPCELSILLVLLNNDIIPIHNTKIIIKDLM